MNSDPKRLLLDFLSTSKHNFEVTYTGKLLTVNSLILIAEYPIDLMSCTVFGKSSSSHILSAILLKHVSHGVELSLLPLVQVLR